MTETADANLVIAALNPADALHERARRHLSGRDRLLVPYSVGIELLFIARRHRATHLDIIVATEDLFDVERAGILRTAAEALDSGELRTVFDAVHVSDALHRGSSLHTTDAALLRSDFPTTAF